MRSWKQIKRELKKDFSRSKELLRGIPPEELLRDRLLEAYVASGYENIIDIDLLYDVATLSAKEAVLWRL